MMNKRNLLTTPRSISFRNDIVIHVTTDVMKSAFSTEESLQYFIDTIFTNIIEREEAFIDVWCARDYDIECYSSWDGCCIFGTSPSSRHDRQKGVIWYMI